MGKSAAGAAEAAVREADSSPLVLYLVTSETHREEGSPFFFFLNKLPMVAGPCHGLQDQPDLGDVNHESS